MTVKTKPRTRFIFDIDSALLQEVHEIAKAGDMSSGKFISMVLEQVRPSFPELLQVFEAAKAKRLEAFDHLQTMASKASIQAGAYGIGVADARRKAAASISDEKRKSKAKRGSGGKSK